MLELKTVWNEIKDLIGGLSSKLDTAKESICQMEYRSLENT